MIKNYHKSFIRLLCLAIMLLFVPIPNLAQAQAPLPKTPPKLTIRWLKSLTIDPTPVKRDNLTSIIATLALIRPAAAAMEINIELSGAFPLRGNPGMQLSDCVWTGYRVHVNQSATGVSFQIYTGSRQVSVGTGTPPTPVPKIFTITARYGSEKVSNSFTVNCPQ